MDHNIPNANVYPCNNLFIARTKIQHKKKGLRWSNLAVCLRLICIDLNLEIDRVGSGYVYS